VYHSSRPHRLRFPLAALALTAGTALSGCSGVVKNLNSAQVKAPNIVVGNAFGINSQAVVVPVGGAAPALQTYAFPNQQPINQADVQSATLSLDLAPTLTLATPGGGGAIPSFTLNSLVVTPEVDKLDAAGKVVSSLTLAPLMTAGPLTFTQQAGGGGNPTYAASGGAFQLQQTTPTSGADVQTLVSLITSGGNSNQVILKISADAAGLPAGTSLSLTVSNNQLVVRTGTN